MEDAIGQSELLAAADNNETRSLTPIQARMVLKAVRNWKQEHEIKINNKISDIRTERRDRNVDAESEVNEIVARKVPFDILSKEWFKNNNISIDQRLYLLDSLIPTLVLSIEKLLKVAEGKGLIDSAKPSKDFNPINLLAQLLMRDNPRYSNFSESSPYAKGVRKLLENIKKDAFNQEENRLVKMKADAKQRKRERLRLENLNLSKIKGRSEKIREMCLGWVGKPTGVILLRLVSAS